MNISQKDKEILVDLVYPLGHGSLWDNNELKYSLRSIEKHLANYRHVYVMGEKPAWLQNVVHIPVNETGRSGPERIYRKILRACQEPNLSNPFLFMNDDFFFLKPTDAPTMPFYYDGTLKEAIEKKHKGGPYKEALINTFEAVNGRCIQPALHYDIHTPILYDKQVFRFSMAAVDWKARFGYVIKSLYANTAGAQRTHLPDCKIDQACNSEEELAALIPDRFMFSIGDNAVNEVFKNYMEKLFPLKSNFEI